jgi:hypothetical protein
MCRKRSMAITTLDQNVTFPSGTFDLAKGLAEVDCFNLRTGSKTSALNSVPAQGH